MSTISNLVSALAKSDEMTDASSSPAGSTPNFQSFIGSSSDEITDASASPTDTSTQEIGDSQPQNDPDSTSSEHLSAIRVLLLAMARHKSIQIPSEVLPTRPRVNADEVDPKGGHYDREKTIDYQWRQLPPESTLASGEWEEVFSPFPVSKPAVSRHDPRSMAGLANVLSWKPDGRANLNGAFMNYNEFSYDEGGRVCKLGEAYGTHEPHTRHRDEIKEHIVSFP